MVLIGQPAGDVSSADWQASRHHLAVAAHAAFDDLAARFDVVVAEGAGSPAEINLRSGDYVNMGLARHSGLPTVVVGDIDRGGVFAAMFGTVALLSQADQALITGFVVNKFRGDPALLSLARGAEVRCRDHVLGVAGERVVADAAAVATSRGSASSRIPGCSPRRSRR